MRAGQGQGAVPVLLPKCCGVLLIGCCCQGAAKGAVSCSQGAMQGAYGTWAFRVLLQVDKEFVASLLGVLFIARAQFPRARALLGGGVLFVARVLLAVVLFPSAVARVAMQGAVSMSALKSCGMD